MQFLLCISNRSYEPTKQFSRNMFRGTPKAFESDHKALNLALFAIAKGFDKAVGGNNAWIYMPLMHSEELCHQDDCVKYFKENTDWVKCTL